MKKILKTALLALPLLALGACSAEDPILGSNNNVSDVTEQRYLTVNLVNPGASTRAVVGDQGEYENGTEEENKIYTVDFYFFDVDKQYHSHFSVNDIASEGVDPEALPNGSADADFVRGFYHTNVPVSLVEGEKMPTYVLCIINAVEPNVHEGKSLDAVQAHVLESSTGRRSGFAMNNSVYYGRDEVTGEDNVLIMATPFTSDKLKRPSELKDADNIDFKDVVNIYVERYDAKVNFSLAENAVQPYTTANNIVLTFEPGKWDMNAYEKSMYLLKSYRTELQDDKTPGLTFSEYADINAALFDGWNNPNQYRSFWARSKGYFENNYPLVADDILDPRDAGEDPYTVEYSQYNTVAQEVGKPKYTMESTLKESRLTGKDMGDQYLPLTSIPSVVLTGVYKINGEAKTFYTYGKDSNDIPRIYSSSANDINGTSPLINKLITDQGIVLKKDNNTYKPLGEDDLTTARDVFVVKHPAKESREGLKIGGDVVTLQLQGTAPGYYYYDSNLSQYIELTTQTAINTANRLLYQNLGGAHAYINGKAFFSAPIQHWGWYRTGNENFGKAMSDWDWEKMKVGDFGVVRNHIYTIEISKIAGLGTGIIDESDPLLPPTDKVGYSVHFHVNIQKWATLPKQTWEW